MAIALLSRSVRAFSTSTQRASLSSLLSNPSILLPDSVVLLSNTNEEQSASHYFRVTNPADGHTVAHVPVMDGSHAVQAIELADRALVEWRDDTTASHRGTVLQTWSRLMDEHAHDLATIMTLESGKPLAESKSEIQYARSFLDFYAAEAVRSSSAGGGFLIPTPFTTDTHCPRGQVMALHQAVGVVGVITPWNFPLAMMTRKVGPALAAGCCAIVKPSELTPLSALALHQLALHAGIPKHGVLSIVTSDATTTAAVGTALCTHEYIRKVSFTGSTAVGKLLYAHCSATVKRLSLELGGNAPFLVFEDADMELAVSAAVSSKFRNAGQTCVCADRFLIHESVYDEFCDKFTKAVEERVVVGPGMDASVTMGPLITEAAVQAVAHKVEEAIAEGAVCLTGGQPCPELGPNFYQPTILKDVSLNSRIYKEETFGPVAALTTFQTDDEAIFKANDCKSGLAAYFMTRDLKRAFTVGKRLEAGLVGVNEGVISTALAPFGGVKESGLGREGSTIGIAEYLETKYLFMNY